MASWRHFYCFILFSFLFSIFTGPVKADWYKYQGSPILAQSATGWDSQSVRSPAVIYDNNQFKLYYQGQSSPSSYNWQIGIAYSSDGLNWTKESNNPIITASSTKYITELGLEEPAVLKDSLYKMWYKSDGWWVIRYAYSNDGINWQKYERYVLAPSKDWESHGLTNPSVIYKDGKYWMYYAASGNFNGYRIGLATSLDGINWSEYENNPLSLPSLGHVGRPSVIIYNNQLHLFYHTGYDRGTKIFHVISTDGINWSCDGLCSIVELGPAGSFDSNTIIGPSVIDHNSTLYLYYGATRDGNNWQIGLATNKPITVEKNPLVIIPGLFASWNKDSLFYNQTVNQPDWILNPIVHEYDGLTQTLETIGYQKNKDYYLFNYDWRKGLNSLADDFNIYLNQNVFPQHTNETVNIAGHSLGGLVGRVYLQKYYPNNIGKLLTLGSPHQGAAQTYKAVEAGELDIDNSFFWLAQKIILQLNKDGLKTDKQIISEKLPVVKDLLPTYNFLTDQNNQLISVNSMQVKNDTLLNYLPDFPNLFLNLQSFYGEKGSTTAGYKITARTLYDQLFDFYPDGRPTATNYSQGDYLITSLSANAGNNSIKINNFDHGEIVYKKEAIKKILDSLSINYQENQIIEGQSTQILPSLIFLVLSPASLEVEFNGQTYTENQGMVFIENAQNGNYIIKAKGNSLGRYTIVAGQLTQAKDIWSKIEGEITTNPPSSQTDSYTLNFNSNVIDQTSISSISQLFDELIIYLTDQNKTLKNSDTTKAINNLQIGKNYYLQNNSGRQKSILQIIHQQLFLGRSKLSLADKPKLIYAIEKLENLYNRSLYGYNFGTIPSRLKITLESYKKNILPAQQYLLSQKNLDKNTINNSLILLTIDNKLKLAEENYLKGNYNLTEIYLKSVNELLKEVRKI